jgi:hypothetical protein
MNRIRFYSTVLLVPALTAQSSAQAVSSTGGNDASRHTIIALSGTASPIGGNYLPFSFLNVSLNARHQVAFDAVVAGSSFTTGIFAGSGEATSTIALGINPDPNAPSFGSVGDPFITSTGRVVFNVENVGIFAGDGKTTAPLVRAGDTAPGGGTIGVSNDRAVSDQGIVAYVANIGGSSATTGLFRTDGNETVAIARNDQSPPTGGTFSVLSRPAVNERGQVAFVSEMSGGSSEFAVFRGEGEALTTIFAAGQVVPGSSATIQDFGRVAINRLGQVAAIALTSGASAAALLLGDGTATAVVALDGEPAPKGGTYGDPFGRATFGGPVRLNDRGELAFKASLTNGSSTSGIFCGNGERTTTVALAGTIAPGTTGMFESFEDYKLGVDGRVAFIATLKLGVGGVDATNKIGIWVGTSDEDLQLVVRSGDVIGGKVLTRLPQFGANQFDTNENGVAWVGNFGLAKGVVFSRIAGEQE